METYSSKTILFFKALIKLRLWVFQDKRIVALSQGRSFDLFIIVLTLLLALLDLTTYVAMHLLGAIPSNFCGIFKVRNADLEYCSIKVKHFKYSQQLFY